MNDCLKRKILAKVVKLAVIVCMGSHLYTFGDKINLQRAGGPIEMRFTASLASFVMKMWDQKWTQMLSKEGIKWELYIGYVDDCRLILPAINRGLVWNGYRFVFDKLCASNCTMSDEHYMTEQIAKAMRSLVPFLKFFGEDASMFSNNRLLTLDT